MTRRAAKNRQCSSIQRPSRKNWSKFTIIYAFFLLEVKTHSKIFAGLAFDLDAFHDVKPIFHTVTKLAYYSCNNDDKNTDVQYVDIISKGIDWNTHIFLAWNCTLCDQKSQLLLVTRTEVTDLLMNE